MGEVKKKKRRIEKGQEGGEEDHLPWQTCTREGRHAK